MNHINLKPAFVTVFNLFMSFMKEKMRRRVSQQDNMKMFWDIILNHSMSKKSFDEVSKDRSAFIIGLVQPEYEINTVVRNVGVYYQLTPRYIQEGLNVHSHSCEALRSGKSVVVTDIAPSVTTAVDLRLLILFKMKLVGT
jgi:hypothetical protein